MTSLSELNDWTRYAMDMGEPNLIIDRRKNNKGKPPEFKKFFKELINQITGKEEETVAVDERRHDEMLHMSKYLSVR